MNVYYDCLHVKPAFFWPPARREFKAGMSDLVAFVFRDYFSCCCYVISVSAGYAAADSNAGASNSWVFRKRSPCGP
jgi:hypothetical protein